MIHRGTLAPSAWQPNTLTEFSRLPPGVSVPSVHTAKDDIHKSAEKLSSTLDDYRDLFSQRASQMITGHLGAAVPPGHPLYSRSATLGTLREENLKLRAENAKLRESLEKSSPAHSTGTPGQV